MMEGVTIERYLPSSYYPALQQQFCLVGAVRKATASRVMQLLREVKTRVDELSHLKRIRKRNEESEFVDVLLCFEGEEAEAAVRETLGELLEEVKVESLPVSAPATKQQYQEWSLLWPINFVEQEIYKEIKHSPQEKALISQIAHSPPRLVIFSEKAILMEHPVQPCQPGSIRHSVMTLLQLWPTTQAFQSLPSAYYLTKMRLYCPHSLCGMCAMALVHSRLQRIYLAGGAEVDLAGEILSCERLNHRVRIFRVQK